MRSQRAPQARVTTQLAGYEATFNKHKHVDYIGADGNVYELFLWRPTCLGLRPLLARTGR